MSEIIPIVQAGVVGALSSAISAYIMFKIVKRTMKNEVEEWINSEKGRAAIYNIGILLGNAIMNGAGFQKPTKQRGGLEGLIMEGAAAWLKSHFSAETPQS